MDRYALPVNPGSGQREDPDTGNDDSDPPVWPPDPPTRAALDFLELALTTGIPNPSYGDPDQSHAMPGGTPLEWQTFTPPLEAPFVDESILDMCILDVSDYSTPEQDPGTLPSDEVSWILVDDVPDASLGTPDQQDPNALANDSRAASVPRGVPPPRPRMPLPRPVIFPLRPQPHGVLRLDCSIYAPKISPDTSMDGMSELRQSGPSAARQSVESQLPQGEAEQTPPGIVEEARPQRKIKIKSRAAVLYHRELKKKEQEQAAEAESREEDMEF